MPAQCVQSLAVQARWLTKRLEIHLLGNHLFANAKALVFAGLFFQGEEAEAWLHKGLAIIARELPEQILADGGHFERSTMYHALAFEDMLDLCNIAQVYAPTRHAQIKGWREVARKMRGWLTAMCHPDGEIGLFNDAALGIAPSVAELLGYADRLALAGPQVQAAQFRHLASSGYVRLEAPDMLALLDVAPIGPDYLPGHAHADTLTFECSFHGQRVFVNSGTSCYGISAERLRQRGTAAHNTVVVDGENSSEVWGGFRVARRARPLSLKISHENGDRIACSHDGYRRLPGQPVHRRTWFVNGQLRIEDAVSGRFGHAQARFHLHPDVKVQLVAGGSTVSLALPDGHEIRCEVERGVASLEPSTYHPRFGVSQATHCLVVELVDGLSVVRIDWN
nr:alginate lyase family protein [Thauera linaloolentis]